MRAGRMNQRVALLERSVTRDALGGEAITWTQAREVWAEVMHLEGREYFAALQVNAEDTLVFRVRYQDATDVTSEWRLQWRARQYDILDVVDVNTQARTLELRCQTAAH